MWYVVAVWRTRLCLFKTPLCCHSSLIPFLVPSRCGSPHATLDRPESVWIARSQFGSSVRARCHRFDSLWDSRLRARSSSRCGNARSASPSLSSRQSDSISLELATIWFYSIRSPQVVCWIGADSESLIWVGTIDLIWGWEHQVFYFLHRHVDMMKNNVSRFYH